MNEAIFTVLIGVMPSILVAVIAIATKTGEIAPITAMIIASLIQCLQYN